MYKSSMATFVYKYLFTPIWGGGFLLGIILTWNNEDQFSHDWSRGAAVMVGWALIWLIILMVRLKRVEANDSHFVIKSFNGEKAIDYSDIEYVSQIALINPELISIKYRDTRSGETTKILVIPGTLVKFKWNPFEEHDMTKYIRGQIVKRNPNYSTEAEPSRWATLGFILLTGIPIMIYVSFFLMNLNG